MWKTSCFYKNPETVQHDHGLCDGAFDVERGLVPTDEASVAVSDSFYGLADDIAGGCELFSCSLAFFSSILLLSPLQLICSSINMQRLCTRHLNVG